jgi:hypothetical protein
MLNKEENIFASKWAYVPEHIPDYFCSFSDADPFLDHDLIYYTHSGGMNIIAYPLTPDSSRPGLIDHITSLAGKFKPRSIKTISPVQLNISGYKPGISEKDFYSCLELDRINKNAKLRNMLKRASADVYVSRTGSFTKEHLLIFSDFIKIKEFDLEKAAFFHRLPDYLAQSPGSLIIEARFIKDQRLAGFTVFESGLGDYGFYLFNISANESRKIPGINDLLLDGAINEIKALGKKFINMGLGVNPGIERFKAKWGAARFLPYHYQYFEPAFSWRNFLKRG